MARYADANWDLPEEASWGRTHAAILMDLRDRLTVIRDRLNCSEAREIPSLLRRIARAVEMPRRGRVERFRDRLREVQPRRVTARRRLRA